MIKVKKEVIDGVTFEVTKLGFADSRELFLRLTKRLGPGLIGVLQGSKSLADLSLVDSFERLVNGLDVKELEEVTEQLGTVTRYQVDGKWPFLDADHRELLFGEAGLLLYFRWLLFALRVQYADFWTALAAPSVPARADEKERSQPGTPNS